MVERRTGLARIPMGSAIRLALVGMTLVFALIVAVAIANLYDARQTYENQLARAYALEASSARLLAAGVVEEVALRQRGHNAATLRRGAAAAFDGEAARAAGLARADVASARLVRVLVRAERRARRLAARGGGRRLRRAIAKVRRASADLAARQATRRRAARDKASDDSRGALITAAVAGGLALLAVLLLVGGLIGSIRRPLDDLVRATRRLAGGALGERVKPAGPQELSALGQSFNAMADELSGAQARIEAEREKLAVTIESLGDALVVCDADGVVQAVNPRARVVVPQLEPGARAYGDDSPLPDLEEALSGEVMREEEGERTLSITASRLGEEGDQGVVWTIRDVTERARLEKTKSDFVATASHELRSPLTSIKGFVELLSRSKDLPEREREFVEVILQSTDRLVDLVNDLLDVARLEAGRMEVHPRLFDVGEVLREVVTLMGPRLSEKQQRLDLHVPPGLPRALADPARVRQIVNNLVSNAHAYTGEGGRLSVSVRPDNGNVALAISDTGRGMSAEELEHIWDRFVRREDGAGGTGLGLSIVRALVDIQGGSIDVDSEPGRGTTFTVRLPAEPGEEAEAPRTAIRGKRVLVVDDEPAIARLMAEQLKPFEVEAEVAHSGDEALERLREGRFDAMTLDMLMPGRSGLDVLQALRDDPELRRTPVVIVSILSGSEALLGEWKVTKPIDPDELADVLGSAVLAGRTSVLVVGRSAIRPRLEPALVRLGLDHEWVTSGTAAAQACSRRRFEVALVDAGIRSPQAVMKSLDLRGRRLSRAVVLFSTGDDAPGVAHLGSEPVPVEDAAGAVLRTLSGEVA